MTSADLIKRRQSEPRPENEPKKETPTSILDDLTFESQAQGRMPAEALGMINLAKYPSMISKPMYRDYYNMHSPDTRPPVVLSRNAERPRSVPPPPLIAAMQKVPRRRGPNKPK